MARPIDLRRALVALGAALLFVSLFLDWYEAGGSAWEVFEALDMVLAGIAGAAVSAALRDDAPPVLLRLLPPLALGIVVVQLLNPPPVLQLATDALNLDDAGDPDVGLWLALAGSALMTAGAVLSMARISLVVDVAGREAGAGGAAGDQQAGPDAPEAPERRSSSLLGLAPQDEAGGQPAGDDPSPEPGAPVREVPAVDRRAADPRPADEPAPTQPLPLPPDEPR